MQHNTITHKKVRGSRGLSIQAKVKLFSSYVKSVLLANHYSNNEAAADYGQQTVLYISKHQVAGQSQQHQTLGDYHPAANLRQYMTPQVALGRPHPMEASDEHHMAGFRMNATREKTERTTQ